MEPNEPLGRRTRPPVEVSIVVFRECDPSIIYGVYDTLWAAGRFWNQMIGRPPSPLFRPRLVAASAAPLELATGVTIVPHDSMRDVDRSDIVFVPNVMVDTPASIRALDRDLVDWVAKMHAAGAQLVAACGGSIVLAEAGVLRGHQATTHWCYAPLFRQEFPDVDLQENRILVQGGRGHSLVCSGGASSWQDLCLYLIARHGSMTEAIRISRIFLYQWHRDGQQPYASMVANVGHNDTVILRCQEWLAENYDAADVIARVAASSGLPKRTFDRRFRAATGYSPLSYVQSLRIEEAKQLLETRNDPVEEVARLVGYEDAASFRRLFRRLVGMAPGEYRRKYDVPRSVRDLTGTNDWQAQMATARPAAHVH